MRYTFFSVALAISLGVPSFAPALAESPKSVDIKKVAPAEAFLAVYAQYNPDGEIQRQHMAEAWKTFQDEQIGARLISLFTSRVPQDKLADAKSKIEELRTAAAPIDLHALCSAKEVVVFEMMEPPFTHALWAVRLSSSEAVECERGMVQTLELAAGWSQGKVTVEKSQVQDGSIAVLKLPKESPYKPAVGRLGDIVLFGSDESVVRRSLTQLQDATAKSKFDDPRLLEALTKLPKADDATVFFDARQLFESLKGVGGFIRSQAKDDKALRVAKLFDRVIQEVAVVDYSVTVKSAKPDQNREVSLTKLADGVEGTALGALIAQPKAFENWQSWVPKDATTYNISTGLNLHLLYDRVVKFLREEIPESQQGLDKFAEVQDRVGVNLDRDILQSFSGQRVSVTVPVAARDGSTSHVSVTALKCENPDKIRELLARGIDALSKLPALAPQQIKLEECKDLEGFQELHVAMFQTFGAQPVIGFSDGWMIVGSNPEGVKKVLAVRSGKAESIDASSSFSKFGINANQPVSGVSYHDVGSEIRDVADMIDKVGGMAPMFLAMAASKAKPEEIKPAQDALALLPSVAKVIRKLDFYGHSLTVTSAGPMPGTYLRESVTEIRPVDAR